MKDILIHLFYTNEVNQDLTLAAEQKHFRVYSDCPPSEILSGNFTWISGYPNYINSIPNGHYVKVEIDSNKFAIDLDTLGLRDAFQLKLADGSIIISTRIDWLKYFSNLKINFRNFGSRWLFTHQFNLYSIINGVNRLISARYEIDFATKQISKFDKEIEFTNQNFDFEQFYNTLNNNIKSVNGRISLSLSGGLDSRVLLSVLLKHNYEFETHTFGTDQTPDVIIANTIAKDLALEHFYIQDYFNENNLDKRLMNFASTDLVGNPVSKAIHLDNYNKLFGRDIVIIDGGFAEIWRAEYFKKLIFLSEKTLLEFHPNKISNELRFYRSDIFNDEINNEMKEGCYEDLINIKKALPNPLEIGLQNWVDLLALKTRLPNFFGYEQKRLDESFKSFMPFIQLGLVQNLWGMPLNLRRNAKMFRKIISQNVKTLEKYKLAKTDYSVNYKLTSLQTAVYLKIIRKIKKLKVNDISTSLFEKREMILDLLNEEQIYTYKHYNHDKIKKLIQEYKSGNLTVNSEIDWLLSFELFRRQNSITS